jgi:hypothetical protein
LSLYFTQQFVLETELDNADICYATVMRVTAPHSYAIYLKKDIMPLLQLLTLAPVYKQAIAIAAIVTITP